MKLIKPIYWETGLHTGLLSFEHDGVPTYEECRQLIREIAHLMRERSGETPSDEVNVKWWLKAEYTLFGQQENHLTFGGYRIFVRDLTKPKVNDFYDFYEVAIVGPAGPVFITKDGYESR